MTNLYSILKSTDITLPTKVHSVKTMVFPVVMYGCESWTIKKAEHQKIDTFVLWCWRRLLRVPLDSKKIQPVHPEANHYAKAFDSVDHNKMWKILQEIRIPDNLTCLLRNMYAGQEATVRTRYETTDWFQIGKGIGQGWILSPCLFTLYSEYII